MRVNINDNQEVLSFMVSQTTYIESQVYRIRYPDILYRTICPVDTSAGEWSKSVTYFSIDRVGEAAWFDGMADDMRMADINRGKFEQGIEMAGIGYKYNLEEISQAMMIPGLNLSAERAAAAVRASEEFVDRVVRVGDSAKGFTGMFNNGNVTVATVATVSGQTTWAQKAAASDPDAIIADVNAALTAVYTGSDTAEMADTVLLPIAQMQILSNTRLPNTGMSALTFLTANNTWTAVTKQPLTILGALNLDTAGATGGPRMVAYKNDPTVLKLHMPMPHRFLDVRQVGDLTYRVPGILRIGSVEIRRPGTMVYYDGL